MLRAALIRCAMPPLVETELMLADLESLERRMAALVKKKRGGDKQAAEDLVLMEKLLACLADGRPGRAADTLTAAEMDTAAAAAAIDRQAGSLCLQCQ